MISHYVDQHLFGLTLVMRRIIFPQLWGQRKTSVEFTISTLLTAIMMVSHKLICMVAKKLLTGQRWTYTFSVEILITADSLRQNLVLSSADNTLVILSKSMCCPSECTILLCRGEQRNIHVGEKRDTPGRDGRFQEMGRCKHYCRLWRLQY